MTRKQLIIIIGIAAIILLILGAILFFKKNNVVEVVPVTNTNTVQIPGREILTPEEKKTATGAQIEEEKQIGDPYYFFNLAGASYDVIARSVTKNDMPVLIDRTKSLIYELERMKNVTGDEGLLEQVNFMLLRAKVFQEALDDGDRDLINAAFEKLRVIDTLREQLLEAGRVQ